MTAGLLRAGCTDQGSCNDVQMVQVANLAIFGHIAIDGATEVMTVTLKDVNDNDLWAVRIEPTLQRWTRSSKVWRT
jgi:hypothetical protein